MNSLAHAVHDLIVGRKPVEAVSGSLTAEQQTVLRDLRSVLCRSPRALADLLAAEDPGPNWPSPSVAVRQMGS